MGRMMASEGGWRDEDGWNAWVLIWEIRALREVGRKDEDVIHLRAIRRSLEKKPFV